MQQGRSASETSADGAAVGQQEQTEREGGADESLRRRHVLQALAIPTGSALAGCGALGDGDGPAATTDGGGGTPSASGPAASTTAGVTDRPSTRAPSTTDGTTSDPAGSTSTTEGTAVPATGYGDGGYGARGYGGGA